MVSFLKKAPFVLVVFALLFVFTFISEASDAQPFYNKLSIGLEGGGVYQFRKAYKLIQHQDEVNAPATIGGPLDHDVSGWGGFGKLIFGYPVNEKSTIQLSISGLDIGTKKSSQISGGTGPGGNPTNTTLLPFLDGSTFSNQQAVEIGGDKTNANAQANLGFDYLTTEADVQLDLVRAMGQRKNWDTKGVLGLAYAYFDQDASFATDGVDFDNSSPTHTQTKETLQDNLIGLKGGIKGIRDFNKALLLDCSLNVIFYYRMTNFKAEQNFVNASLPFTGSPANRNIGVGDSENNFVPRLQFRLGLIEKSTKRYGFEIFYAFDSWWNMTTVNNPTVRYTGTADVIDHPARISHGDCVCQHYVGLKLTW